MTTHTPLPWSLNGSVIVARDGAHVATLHAHDDQPHICMPSREERDANWLLIHRAVNERAALIEALREVVEEVCDGVGVAPEDPWYATMLRARTLLAQAEATP